MLNLFVVDDSALIHQLLISSVEEIADAQIIGQSATVADAIYGIQQLQPDVVILDLRLSDGSGLDVLQAIREDEGAPVVIVLTQYAYAAYRERCLDAGADHFFDKASEFGEVFTALSALEGR